MEKAVLNSDQLAALGILESEANVFLTGVAGSGKSFLIRQYLRRQEYPVLASTGAAAILVGGRTFHSFFGLGIMQGGYKATVERALENRRVVNRLVKTKGVVIDEVSMLSGQTLRAAEEISRRARKTDRPWGGMRVVAVGDFAQLPPVSVFEQTRDWAFLDPSWQNSEFRPALLKTTVRTQDEEFLSILNSVRNGECTSEVRDFLNSRTLDSAEAERFEGTRLFPRRETVERFNLAELERIEAEPHEFVTEYFGDSKAIEDLKRNAPIGEMIRLKKGALVMLRQNDPQLRWVNGSLAQVDEILPEQKRLRLTLLEGGRMIELEQISFTILNAEGLEVASARNFPVNLAYATTIHKSQGMTLDRVLLDLRNLWEPGQAYVALSRVKRPEGVHLSAWTPSSIRMDAAVRVFYERLATAI